MKTSSDPRHKKRQQIVKQLFSTSFQPRKKLNNKSAQMIYRKRVSLDRLISKAAPEWGIKKINRIDLAILRLAVWELTTPKSKVPLKVVVDEAVELAKQYGAEGSSGFVNGVLGTIIKQMNNPKSMLACSRGLRPRIARAQLRGSGVPADFSAKNQGSSEK